MATVIRSRLDVIMLAIQARLMAVLGWPAERVLIVDPDKADIQPHEQYLMLWPDTEAADIPIYVGAGRTDTREDVRLEVTLKTRLALDEATSDLAWLTDQSLGHLKARHAVYDALLEPWAPTDTGTDAGSWLVVAPLAPAQASRPRKDQEDKAWGTSRLYFSFSYELDL